VFKYLISATPREESRCAKKRRNINYFTKDRKSIGNIRNVRLMMLNREYNLENKFF
jgi:hypothetical protein